jgi:hypothetical protein
VTSRAPDPEWAPPRIASLGRHLVLAAAIGNHTVIGVGQEPEGASLEDADFYRFFYRNFYRTDRNGVEVVGRLQQCRLHKTR